MTLGGGDTGPCGGQQISRQAGEKRGEGVVGQHGPHGQGQQGEAPKKNSGGQILQSIEGGKVDNVYLSQQYNQNGGDKDNGVQVGAGPLCPQLVAQGEKDGRHQQPDGGETARVSSISNGSASWTRVRMAVPTRPMAVVITVSINTKRYRAPTTLLRPKGRATAYRSHLACSS